MEINKIFIDQESQTGDFLMRMPADALPAFYEMLCAAPLTSRRWFYQVKQYLEENYNAPLAKAGLVKPKAQAPAPVALLSLAGAASPETATESSSAVPAASPAGKEKEGGAPC